MFFLEDIYCPRSFKRDRIFRKHIKQWRAIAPDLQTLRIIAETLRELEIVFMYDNSSNSSFRFESSTSSNIYSSIRQKDGSDSLVVDGPDMTILVNLNITTNAINITIRRKQGSKIETHFKFRENDETEFSPQDQMLIAIVEDRIMTTFCDLLEYYYYGGAHRDINPKFLPEIVVKKASHLVESDT